jgi:hypothetical protein
MFYWNSVVVYYCHINEMPENPLLYVTVGFLSEVIQITI